MGLFESDGRHGGPVREFVGGGAAHARPLRPAQQTRAGTRRPERAGARRKDHRYHPPGAAGADHPRTCRQRRAGDRGQPFRAAARQGGAKNVVAADRAGFAGRAGPAGSFCCKHGRRRGAGGSGRSGRRRGCCAGEYPVRSRRGSQRSGFFGKTRGTGRGVRQRRFFRRSPRPCQHRRGCAPSSCLCRAAHANGVGGPGTRADHAGTAGHGRGGRREGVNKTRPAAEPHCARAGPGDRRRHGEHVSRRTRSGGRAVAAGEQPARYRARRAGRGGQCRRATLCCLSMW